MRSRLINVGLAVGYAGLIFFLSSQSTLPVPRGFVFNDKLIHCVEYGVLAFLIARCLAPWAPAAAIAAILSSLYGVSDEFHQSFVPGRSSDGYDILADAVGSAMGAAAFTFHMRQRSRVNSNTQ